MKFQFHHSPLCVFKKSVYLLYNPLWLPLTRELSAKLTEGENFRQSIYHSTYSIYQYE